ncbi:MAG TPA: amino acid ABC transporter ATP-binding protein [Pseudomonas sp.]|jgi:polar amino acid transport system ATP-binding protein|uniref:amino acid ABC transporter ATP-binding protein n=1 Tax=Pseudomonas sp. TaxID=306 RepID=UPI002EDA0FBD
MSETTHLPLLRLRGLHKRFGTLEVLKGIDLDVQPGSVVVLIGPSGSGKSTLIRMLNGLVQPDQGTLELRGQSLNIHSGRAWQKLRLEVGMVFQDYTLFPHLNVLDNITLTPVRRKLCSLAEAQADARKLLTRVGLEHKADAWPSELSGGQQQRVAIVRALAMRPKAMLFDEPTSALDPETIGDVLKVMRDLADEGMTMVVVTHEMSFAREVADQVVFMAGGKVVEQAPPQVMFTAPEDARTRQFLSSFITAGN